jgi:[protein-PII] uridylyltransferase
LVGALFHDIGKARGADHCGKGEVLMRSIAPALGFSVEDTQTLCAMVKLHLLLPESATRRDLEDPATIESVVSQVQDHELLDLLHNLAIADSKATSAATWSEWKQRLLEDLVRRCHASIAGTQPIAAPGLAERFPVEVSAGELSVVVTPGPTMVTIFVAAPDRLGLLTTVAGALALLRLEVRAAYLETIDNIALQEWHVAPSFGDLPDSGLIKAEILRALRQPEEIEAKVTRLMSGSRPRRGFIAPDPVVRCLPDASNRSTVIEVRSHDEPALLYRVGQALITSGVTVISARVMTLGSEVVDVLYVQNASGVTLSEEALQAVLAGISEAVQPSG